MTRQITLNPTYNVNGDPGQGLLLGGGTYTVSDARAAELVNRGAATYADSSPLSAAPVTVTGVSNIVADPSTGIVTVQSQNSAGAVVTSVLTPKVAAPALGGLGLWLPFTTQRGQPNLVDRSANIVFTNGGTALNFNGTGTVTIPNGANAAVSDAGHGLSLNDPVMFQTTGQLPAPLVPGQVYFAVAIAAGTYQLSLTPNGTSITTTTNGSGTHTVVRKANPNLPAVQFNGNGYLQSDITVMTFVQRALANISTLTDDQQLDLCFDLSHPASLTTASLAYWNRNATQGWGLSLNGAPGKIVFDQVAPGATRDQYTVDTSFNLRGDNALNTRTALAVSISRSPVDICNIGNGAGLYDIEMHKIGINDQGPFGQKNSAHGTPARVPNTGTGPVTYGDVGFTFGMRPTSAAGTGLDQMPSSYGLNMICMRRGARQAARASVIARDLANLISLGRSQLQIPDSMAL